MPCGAATRASIFRSRRSAEPALLGPQQLSWLERLDAERDNLRAALTWATEEDEADIGLRIGAALWRYWQLRGLDSEGRERLERLLALRSGSEEARAVALAMTASLSFFQGDHEAVRRYGDASLPVLRRLGATSRLAGTLGVMAHFRPGAGRPRPGARARRGGARGRAALGRPHGRVVRASTAPVSCMPGAGSSTRPSA